MGRTTTTAEDYAWALARAFGEILFVRREQVIKLYQVFAREGVAPAVRRDILKLVALAPTALSDRPVASAILADPSAAAALARDYMLLLGGEDGDGRGGTFVRGFVRDAALSTDQVRVLVDWVKLENKVLRAMGAGEEWLADERDWRELGSRAAGVGLPVTALYFAGITGFSAVGLTSGLAAIGGTAGAALVALGLNPMTAGIAVLIGGGIAVKKIADHALGVKSKKAAADEARAGRVELLVNTIAMLSADLEALPRFAGEVAANEAPRARLEVAMTEAVAGLQAYAARTK